MSLAPALIARFRADLFRLATPERIGVAVSGGPDSLALLLLTTNAFPGRVHAATVDHGLRPEAAAEADMVARLCADLGVPHAKLKVAVPDGPAGLQAEARAVRYAALRGWAGEHGIGTLLTAHHADDQAETVLMRLQRGAGLAGLAGIRAVRDDAGLAIVRPLLGWSKAELDALVADAGIEAADDPSNRDPRFDRAAMRAFLAKNPQFEPARLARSAAALAEAEEALAWSVDGLAERITRSGEIWHIDPAGLPRAIVRRLLARAIGGIRAAHGLEPAWTGGEDVEPMLAALESGDSATRAGVMASPGAVWKLRAAPPRRDREASS